MGGTLPAAAGRRRRGAGYRLVAGGRHRLVRVRRMGRSLRIALLSYRSKPHSGGQGIYVRALSRELAELGHRVEVLSGQPYPELDDGVAAHPAAQPGPLPRARSRSAPRGPSEFRDWIDVAEWATMCTAGFPEPMTFSLRAARHLLPRAAEFDVVHDNQSLGWGLLRLVRAGLPTVATVHHPIAIDRRAGAGRRRRSLRRRLTLRRWYGFTGMQARVAARLDAVTTVSENSRRDIATAHGPARRRHRGHPGRHRPRRVHPAAGRAAARPRLDPGHHQRRRRRSRAWCTCSRRWPSCAPSGRCGSPSSAPPAPAARPRPRWTGSRCATPSGSPGRCREAELVDLLQRAAVVAIPSLYEGFSLPAVEAMACATPLVTTDAGALPEVVGTQGRAAGAAPATSAS